MTAKPYSTSERRIALLIRFREGGATMEHLKGMPVYQTGAAEDSIQRMIERDISALRESGHRISSPDPSDRTSTYQLDESTNIRVDGTSLDLTLLRELLAERKLGTAGDFAQSGVTKLLAEGDVHTDAVAFHLHVPAGDAVIPIAAAIQSRETIELTYHSTSRPKPAKYVVEPWQLEIHFDCFYLRGYQLSVDGDRTQTGTRMYNLMRAISVRALDQPMVHEVDASAGQLVPVTAVVQTRKGTCTSFVSRGQDHCDVGEWVEFTLANVDAPELYDDLAFYGTDARLVGPPELVADYYGRLDHMAALAHADSRRKGE